jgi:hypothetical protein
MPPERRPVGELLVLIITGTVCAILLVVTVGIVVLEAIDPDADTSGAGRAISGVLSTLTGVAAGFLAGRTDRRRNGPDNR